MQNYLKKALSLGLVSAAVALSPMAFAEKKAEAQTENIDVTQKSITKDELAAIYVLSETCPKLITKDDKFDAGFNRLLKDYLPQEKQPATALNALMKQSAYQSALKQAQADFKKAGDKVNTQVCNDVKDY